MKSKTFVVLLLLCGILGGLEYFLFNERAKKNQPKFFGKLFEFVSANDIDAIQIISSGGLVKLKKATIWQVESRYNFPANFAMITEFIIKLKDLKVDRSFKATDDTISRLALRSPDDKEAPESQKGTRIIFEDKNMKVLADLILGSSREAPSGSGGNYLKFVKEDTIHLVDKNFKFLDKESSKWIDKDLIRASADEIESVSCGDLINKSIYYSLKRPEKGKEPEMLNMPPDKKLDKAKVNSLFSAIASFQCEDLADPSKTIADTGMDVARVFEFRLFDGRIYKLYVGKAVAESPEKYYFKMDADYVAPSEKPDLKDEQKKAAEKKQQKSALSEHAEITNKKISTWTFIVAKWRYDNFIGNVKDLFEQEKPAEDNIPK